MKPIEMPMKLASLLMVVVALWQPGYAQTATLRGQVADESGAVIPGATITVTGPAEFSRTTKAANDGSYVFTDLPPGSYTVQASAPQLALPQAAKISLKAGAQTLNLKLNVALAKEQVTVEDTAGGSVTTEAAN